MAKIEIEDSVYDGETLGLNKVRDIAAEAGVALRKDFRADDVFPKTDPLAKRLSSYEAMRNTVESLAKEAKLSVDRETALRTELAEATAAVGTLISDNKHLLKGDRPCKDCRAMGKSADTGEPCKSCSGTGWTPAPAVKK